jgi:uncharacterized membrane protein
MPRIPFNRIPPTPASSNKAANALRYVLFSLFLLNWLLVWLRLWLCPSLLNGAHWPEGLLSILAVTAVGAALNRQLPLQNVVLVSCLVAFLGGVVSCLGAVTSIPFGPFFYTDQIGQEILPHLPAVVPLLWVTVLLTCRGVVRLILRPWQGHRNYGFYILGLAAVLVVLFDLALDPFAVKTLELWRWAPTQLPLTWYSAPIPNFLGWGVSGLLILAFATPSLINKKPVRFPPNYYPLWIWLLLMALFLTAAAVHHLRAAVVLISLQMLAVTFLSFRGCGKTAGSTPATRAAQNQLR